MTTRFPVLALDEMTDAQRPVAEAIMAGPRGGLRGPFNAWLRSPVLADRLQKVGEFLRFETSLDKRLNEMAILITARRWTAQFEWYAHHRMAMAAGLDPAIAAAIAEGKRPEGMQADETAVYDFVTQLKRTGNVSDAVYGAVVALFGERGAVELIAVTGYYDLVSMTLNVAGVELPEGEPLPLKAL